MQLSVPTWAHNACNLHLHILRPKLVKAHIWDNTTKLLSMNPDTNVSCSPTLLETKTELTASAHNSEQIQHFYLLGPGTSTK